MNTMSYTDTLTILNCGECHIPFAVPQSFERRKRDDGSRFHCPNGCTISYEASNEKKRMGRQLANTEESLRIARADAEVERNRSRSYKGHVTRVKNRVAKGKCPCCSRQFPDLAAHMAETHPGYEDD